MVLVFQATLTNYKHKQLLESCGGLFTQDIGGNGVRECTGSLSGTQEPSYQKKYHPAHPNYLYSTWHFKGPGFFLVTSVIQLVLLGLSSSTHRIQSNNVFVFTILVAHKDFSLRLACRLQHNCNNISHWHLNENSPRYLPNTYLTFPP